MNFYILLASTLILQGQLGAMMGTGTTEDTNVKRVIGLLQQDEPQEFENIKEAIDKVYGTKINEIIGTGGYVLGRQNDTMLTAAIRKARADVVEYLLKDKKANPNTNDPLKIIFDNFIMYQEGAQPQVKNGEAIANIVQNLIAYHADPKNYITPFIHRLETAETARTPFAYDDVHFQKIVQSLFLGKLIYGFTQNAFKKEDLIYLKDYANLNTIHNVILPELPYLVPYQQEEKVLRVVPAEAALLFIGTKRNLDSFYEPLNILLDGSPLKTPNGGFILQYAAINERIFTMVKNATWKMFPNIQNNLMLADIDGRTLLSNIIICCQHPSFLPLAIRNLLGGKVPTEVINHQDNTNVSALGYLVAKFKSTDKKDYAPLKEALNMLLSEHGASPDLNYQGKPLIEWARNNIGEEIANMLNQNKTLKAAFDALNDQAPIAAFKDIIKTLPEGTINAIDPVFKESLLGRAAYLGNNQAIQALLINISPANINAPAGTSKPMPGESARTVIALYMAIKGLSENPSKLNDYAQVINTLIAYGSTELAGYTDTNFYEMSAQEMLSGQAQTKIANIFSFSKFVQQLLFGQTEALKSLQADKYQDALEESLDYNANPSGQPIKIENNTPLIITLKLINDYYNKNNYSFSPQQIKLLDTLLSKVNADTRNKKNELPIIYALFNQDIFAKVLDKMSPDSIRTPDANGKNENILMLVADKSLNAVEANIGMLLNRATFTDASQSFAYINQTNTNGQTAIMLLLNQTDYFFKRQTTDYLINAIKRLKAAGADVIKQDKNGNSADTIINKIPNSSLKKSLLAVVSGQQTGFAGSRTIDLFVEALKTNNQEAINTFIAEKLNASNINLLSSENLTPLMAVISYGNTATIQKILTVPGINLYQVNSRGKNAFDHLVNYYNQNQAQPELLAKIDIIMKLLIAAGLVPNEQHLALLRKKIYLQNPVLFTVLVEALLIKYAVSKEVTKFNTLLNRYKTEISQHIHTRKANITINIAPTGQPLNIITGNLLQALLQVIETMNSSRDRLDPEYTSILSSIAKTIPLLMQTFDEKTHKLILSYGTFNSVVFKLLGLSTTEQSIMSTDNDGNSVLSQVIASSPIKLLRDNINTVLSRIEPTTKTSLVSMKNAHGENALDALILRAPEVKDLTETQDFEIAVSTLKKVVNTINSSTIKIIEQLPESDLKKTLAKMLGASTEEKPADPTTLINHLRSLNSTLQKLRRAL